MRQYLMKAIQDDSQRVGERDCLLLEARRAGVAPPARRSRRPRQAPGTGCCFARPTAWDSGLGAGQPHGRRPYAAIEHTERPQGLKSWWMTEQPQQASPLLAPNQTI
jgi:hypothetical protein